MHLYSIKMDIFLCFLGNTVSPFYPSLVSGLQWSGSLFSAACGRCARGAASSAPPRWRAEDVDDGSAQTTALKGCAHRGGRRLLLLQLRELFQRQQRQRKRNICPRDKRIKVSSIPFSIQGGEMLWESTANLFIL